MHHASFECERNHTLQLITLQRTVMGLIDRLRLEVCHPTVCELNGIGKKNRNIRERILRRDERTLIFLPDIHPRGTVTVLFVSSYPRHPSLSLE